MYRTKKCINNVFCDLGNSGILDLLRSLRVISSKVSACSTLSRCAISVISILTRSSQMVLLPQQGSWFVFKIMLILLCNDVLYDAVYRWPQ